MGAPNANAANATACNSVGAASIYLTDPLNPLNPPTRYTLQPPTLNSGWGAYGWSLAAAPTGSRVLLVGEPGRDLGGVSRAGQVYVYKLN